MDIANKVVLITGGASGLGRATAEYMVREKGASVGLLDVNDEAGQAVVAELGADKALFVNTDITDEQAVAAAIGQISGQFGTIHVCINAAGIPTPAKILDKQGAATPLAGFRKVIDVNLIGLFNVLSQCAAVMANNAPENDEERGVIVNVSSGAAFEGQIGQSAYSASKSGILGLNMPASRELARYGIRVNAICPGLFKTPMVAGFDQNVQDSLINAIEAPKRMGRMEEFAHCCAFLIENAYMNGRTIRLDAATVMQAR